MKLYLKIMLIAVAVLFCGCHKKDKVAAPKLTKEQTSKIKNVKLEVGRYEKDLFSLDVNHLSDGIAKLYGQYPENLIPNT